jgi:hypothetical protein
LVKKKTRLGEENRTYFAIVFIRFVFIIDARHPLAAERENMETEIKFRDYPYVTWLMGIGVLIFGTYQTLTNMSSSTWLNSVAGIVIGLLVLILGYGLTITADKQTRILTLDYRSILLHSVKEIPFDDIAAIRIHSRTEREVGRSSRSTTYCIRAELKNGEAISFRTYYTSEFFRKQKIVDGLRKFMDLPETLDATPAGILRAAPQIGSAIAQAQQQSLTGANAETRTTDGVNWQLQSIGIGAAPATRWFSPDFKTQGGFLFLAQKVAGQDSGGFMASLSKMLFKQSISLYGFDASDTPNLAQADVFASLSPALATHFMAFTNDQTESRQLLNPWVQNPLADWGTRYPLQQFQGAGTRYTQIIVLFSPNGTYIATPSILQPDQVEEITKLGVELIKAQGI